MWNTETGGTKNASLLLVELAVFMPMSSFLRATTFILEGGRYEALAAVHVCYSTGNWLYQSLEYIGAGTGLHRSYNKKVNI